MALPTGAEILAALPRETAVTELEAGRYVNTAEIRLAKSHDGVLPTTEETEDLVRRYAERRAWKQHYMKGEGYLDTPGIDKDLDRIEAEFKSYDAEHSTPAEVQAEIPEGYSGVMLW